MLTKFIMWVTILTGVGNEETRIIENDMIYDTFGECVTAMAYRQARYHDEMVKAHHGIIIHCRPVKATDIHYVTLKL